MVKNCNLLIQLNFTTISYSHRTYQQVVGTAYIKHYEEAQIHYWQ